MWDIICTALFAGTAGFIGGAYWIVKYVPGPGVDLDAKDGVGQGPVTHLVVGGHTGCCRRRTDALPWDDLLTADPELVDCAGGDR